MPKLDRYTIGVREKVWRAAQDPRGLGVELNGAEVVALWRSIIESAKELIQLREELKEERRRRNDVIHALDVMRFAAQLAVESGDIEIDEWLEHAHDAFDGWASE